MKDFKILAAAAMLGGGLRIVSSFFSYDGSEILNLFYIIIDLCFVLALAGVFAFLRERLNALGRVGLLLTLCGIALIAGPEATLYEVGIYQIGSPVIGVGTVMFSVNLLQNGLLGRIVPLSFLLSFAFGLLSMLMSVTVLFSIAGIAFGIGFIALGWQLWKGANTLQADL
ncbi:MAG: hypothetical protein MI864_16215 [Pseudomonadales bacterium]|uniref:hypothetical protein n=1 Tax=Oleiphilus messinensis TaxID=141451 RepID=UPI0012FCEA10|nr:hypothetical protein [Oleiphilus messinensis]MCG8612072.1 hypothetical protein [Pseudomonadales bacterium]